MTFLYSPFSGAPLLCQPVDVANWRKPEHRWVFNPYTGTFRNVWDIGSDPHGLLIVSPKDEPLKAATRPDTRYVAILPSGYNRVAIFKGTFITTHPSKAPLYLAENGTWQPLHCIEIPGVT